ncbi:MAG: signal peptide peptidase SppA [Hyphomicrobiales bacterium]|nr:signal peptide peptidase SppA [Hyphomicrobiales bacterium]
MIFKNKTDFMPYRRKLFIWRTISVISLLAITYLLFNNSENTLTKKPHIAKYNITGLLVDADEILEDLEKLEFDENVRAIIISIESPGGTTVSAEEIYLKLRSISSTKPTTAIMRNMATSGAYLISLGTDQIFARENTITGSIGVIFQWARIDEGLAKIGIRMNEIKSGKLKAEPDLFGEIDEKTQKVTQEIIDDTFRWFIRIVKERRNLEQNQVKIVSDGRIFTGRQAHGIELIDQIGGEREAKFWLIENKDIDPDLIILDYEIPNNISFIELSVAKIMDYFNIRTSYSDRLQKNLSLIGLDGLVSIWHHP